MGDRAKVFCLDCDTEVRTPVSRARRIGEGCWRKRKKAARAAVRAAARATLPGLTGLAAPGAGQTPIDGVDDLVVQGDGPVR